MKILSAAQMHEADAYTMEHEPISSIDLMERAANQFVNSVLQDFPNFNKFCIICGKGNNGGDGLAAARIFTGLNKTVSVIICNYTHNSSNDFNQNYQRLKSIESSLLSIYENTEFTPFSIDNDTIIIDALFGSGLNRPLNGLSAQIISYCNSLPNVKISIDIPSGLFADIPVKDTETIFQATETITFQSPKLQFLFAENFKYTGHLHIVDIQLSQKFESKIDSNFQFLTTKSICLKTRSEFAHKGTFGHAFLVSGSFGKMGACILASRACLKTGCGLLTTHIPQCGYNILQTSIPEAMAEVDENQFFTTKITCDKKYSAIGIGPGIGTERQTADALISFLKNNITPLVLDADALNILSNNKDILKYLNRNTIITPHPGEFDRLTHIHTSCYKRFLSQIDFAKKYSCVVILKGKYTSVALPDGSVFFNSTGNSGMATAGSGDVLTGIILSLLCQGYSSAEAAKTGVFLHGLAGDCCLQQESLESLIAGNIIEYISQAFKTIHLNLK